MVKKRLIPCLDVTGGRVVKGIRFVELRDVGDPVEMATRYSELGADELVFLDITATVDGRRPFLELTRAVVGAVTVPVIASGGAGEARHLAEAFEAGASAALIASIVHERPERLVELKAELREAGWPIRS